MAVEQIFRKYGAGFKRVGRIIEVAFGTGANEAAPGSKLPGSIIIDTTGGTTGQALVHDGTKFAPGTASAPPLSIVDLLVAQATLTVGTSSNQTSGCEFHVTRARTCTGIRFYWPGSAARTIRCRIWDTGGFLKSVDVSVPVSSPGIYTGIFSGTVPLTPYTKYRASIRETANSEYAQAALLTGVWIPARPFITQDLVVNTIAANAVGGDLNPTSAGSASYPVEPILL